MGIPCLATYQFTAESRKAFYKKKGTEPTIADIAGTGEIANLSTVVLGMLADDSPESIHKRKVLIMKGRGGETGSFDVNWNFQTMDFDECEEQPSSSAKKTVV
jgi:replicative DNA helicase